MRCGKSFAEAKGEREAELKLMVEWASGGFLPTGPGGFAPPGRGLLFFYSNFLYKNSLSGSFFQDNVNG